jgi:hypothetical protein
VRRFRYLVVGAASQEDAEALAGRLHGEVEAGGEVAWAAQPEIHPSLPIFTIFGGLGR